MVTIYQEAIMSFQIDGAPVTGEPDGARTVNKTLILHTLK